MAASREIPSRHPALLLVCRKCCKRAEGGKSLRKTLQRGLGKDDVRVVQTSCLDVCPKRGVCAVASGAGRDRYLLLNPEADDEALVDTVKKSLRG